MQLIRVKIKNNINEWEEELPVRSLATAKEDIKNIIIKYNEKEKKRYGDEARLREFIQILSNTKQKIHDWQKINNFTQKDRNGYYDEYECPSCHLKKKRYGLGKPSREKCYPDRVCIICNKQFANKINCEKHKTKYHKII